MHPLNLNGKEALVIDVPEWAHDFTMGVKGDNGFEYLNCMGDRIWDEKNIELPEGEWVKLGTLTNGVPDFDCEGWVVKNEYGHEGYRDYVSSTDETSFNWYTASQSFISLLHSQGIDTTSKKVILIKK